MHLHMGMSDINAHMGINQLFYVSYISVCICVYVAVQVVWVHNNP